MTEIKATLLDHMGTDLSVVNAARVSFKKQSEWEIDIDKGTLDLSERDAKLVAYLARHRHTSPFGHAFASFHVKAPIFVARQLVKHKFLRWNEVSRRYVDDEPEFYEPEVWRCRSEDKKQGSEGEHPMEFELNWPDGPQHMDMRHWKFEMEGDILHLYQTLIEQGVAPEQARMVLPQNTMTEWYWSGSLDAFADMCRLRCKPDTQYETRIVADQIAEQMQALFPHSWKALLDG